MNYHIVAHPSWLNNSASHGSGFLNNPPSCESGLCTQKTPPERDGFDGKSRQSSKRYSEVPPPTGGLQNVSPPSGWFPERE
eukprot:6590350-Karenia_brevis.AAC.1